MRLLLSVLGRGYVVLVPVVGALLAFGVGVGLSDDFSGRATFTLAAVVAGLLTLLGWCLLLLIFIAGPLAEVIRRTITTNAAAAWTLEGELANRPRPSFGGWAIEPDSAVALVRVVTEARPSLVLELGPGASTELLSELLGPSARIVGLEHDATHLERLRHRLGRNSSASVEIRHAPLVARTLRGWSGRWYDASAFADLSAIELLVIDGPPGPGSYMARYPALPMLRDRLAPGAAVFVDDTARPDEERAVQRWIDDHGLELLHRGANHTVLRVPPAR
jgi:predicted O-methyltransferase YrrM